LESGWGELSNHGHTGGCFGKGDEMINEYLIGLCAVGVILVANVLAMVLFVLFAKLRDGHVKDSIRSIIFELDKFADNMENAEKRRAAIQQINEVLG
jgi:hypothetical protein